MLPHFPPATKEKAILLLFGHNPSIYAWDQIPSHLLGTLFQLLWEHFWNSATCWAAFKNPSASQVQHQLHQKFCGWDPTSVLFLGFQVIAMYRQSWEPISFSFTLSKVFKHLQVFLILESQPPSTPRLCKHIYISLIFFMMKLLTFKFVYTLHYFTLTHSSSFQPLPYHFTRTVFPTTINDLTIKASGLPSPIVLAVLYQLSRTFFSYPFFLNSFFLVNSVAFWLTHIISLFLSVRFSLTMPPKMFLVSFQFLFFLWTNKQTCDR